jgi:hypothetical protein
MAKTYPGFEDAHLRLIEESPIYFVGTAARDGRVNVSPKGLDSLRVLGPNRLVWRNITGSGNETAGHLLDINRMTVMWCSFTKRPVIMRAYGTARAIHPFDADWEEMNGRFPPHLGARQVFDMTVETVQTSCGYAVPFMEFTSHRDTLDKWTEDRGPEGVRAYWAEENRETIDGLPTGIGV